MSDIRRLTPLLLVCFLAAAAAAFGVSIGVEGAAEGRVTPVDAVQPWMWTVELENPGSVTYDAQLRLDVLQENRTVFRTAAAPARLEPGTRTARTLAVTDPDVQGEVTLRFVMEYGPHEAVAKEETVIPPRNTSDAIAVALPRLRADAVAFLLAAPDDAGDIHVTVHGNPTWRFQQQRVAVDGVTPVTVPFWPADYPGDTLTITASSTDGRYHHTETVRVEDRLGILTQIRALAAVSLPFGHVFIT